jgi:hypothetical protein
MTYNIIWKLIKKLVIYYYKDVKERRWQFLNDNEYNIIYISFFHENADAVVVVVVLEALAVEFDLFKLVVNWLYYYSWKNCCHYYY